MESHPTIDWPAANSWALQLGTAGRIAIALTGIAMLLSILLWALAGKNQRLEKPARLLFGLGTSGFFVAIAALMTLLATKQYTFRYVYSHTDNWLPDMGYRIAATWGGQEGSFLLWACTSSIFALLVAPHTAEYRRIFTIVCAAFLGSLAGILSFESPFALMDFGAMPPLLPPDGGGLTPALINWWMKIHPPTIFMGFGSLLALYAWAIAALWSGDLKNWLFGVRPWAILSMTLTGIGLVMGGFWAYETLGWGGFWMWDPVENASMVPWAFGAAFIHLIFVAIRHEKWPIGTAVFGGLGFIAFNYGTFLTRSGFLGDASVHSFAQMDRSALNLLTTIKVVAALTLTGVAIRAAVRRKKAGIETPFFEPISKWNLTNAYASSATLLTAVGLACAIGMSVPLLMSLRGEAPRVVEEPLYNRVMAYIFIPTVILMGIGPFLSWRGLPARQLLSKLVTAACGALGFVGIGMFLMMGIPKGMEVPANAMSNWGLVQVPLVPWVLFLAFVCLFGIVANLMYLAEHWRATKKSLGAMMTHIGVIICVLGLIVSRGLQRKEQFDVQQGRPGLALGYAVQLESMGNLLNRENRMSFKFTGRNEQFTAQPILFYTENMDGSEPSPTVRPWIQHKALHDKYITVYPLVREASEPFTIQVGQSMQLFENMILTYSGLKTSGPMGQTGATFTAELQVLDQTNGTAKLSPSMRLTEGGMVRQPGEIFDEYFVELRRIDAATKSAELQILYKRPVFPMELYYKPLPGLVWWGAGIMTAGGFLAAFQRRKQRKGPQSPRDAEEATPESPENERSDATATPA